MAKMYYDEIEVIQKLKVTPTELLTMVRDGKLRAYADGARKMFKVGEVDALVPAADAAAAAAAEVELAPAEPAAPITLDAAAAEPITLDAADATGSTIGAGKGDTVITSEGISIFDDEDLEIELADPMAKTQIAPSIEDRISLDSVTGGSGLLDLTRESDDTSLGAEVLDHIDMETGEIASASVESVAESIAVEVEGEPPPLMRTVAPVEVFDPTAGMFTGIAAVGALVMLLVSLVALGNLTGTVPGYLDSLGTQLGMVAAGAVVLAAIAAVIGYVVGKSGTGR